MEKGQQWIVNEGGTEPPSTEKHYSPKEVAALWGLDESTVRKRFQDVAGVLKLTRPVSRRGKRSYVTLRIPQSVLDSFHRERSR